MLKYRKFIIALISILGGIGVGGLLSLLRGDSPIQLENIRPAECQVYWLYEFEPDHTRLIGVDSATFNENLVGSVHKNAEFDGMDIHPASGLIYTSTTKEGDLYILDSKTGGGAFLGTLDVTQVNSLAFHPKDHTLWAWVENRGLGVIDLETFKVDIVYESVDSFIALAWNNEGTMLYAASEIGKFFGYDPDGGMFVELADNLPYEPEAFSMLSDGTILGMNKDEDEELLTLFIYDPDALEIVREIEIESEYVGSGGIAWPKECGNPL